MGNPTGKGGVRFKPGVSGNPSGGKKLSPEVKAFREMTYEDFIDKLKQYGCYTKSELKAVVDNPKTTLFDLIYCRHLYDALNGKESARESLYNRLWGKPKEVPEYLDAKNIGPPVQIFLPDNGRDVIDAEIEKDEPNEQ